MFGLISIILLISFMISKELTMLIAAGLFAIAASIKFHAYVATPNIKQINKTTNTSLES